MTIDPNRLLPHHPVAIDLIISGSLPDPEAYFQGPAGVDYTGNLDFTGLRGPVDVTIRLVTALPLRFDHLRTSESAFQPAQPWPAGDPHHQFRQVDVQPGAITFDYRNKGPKPHHIYAIALVDQDGGTYVLDPYIKNGPAYAAAEYVSSGEL